MKYAIIKSNSVSFGPSEWDAYSFQDYMIKQGINVSFSLNAPIENISWNDGDISLVSVVEITPPFDPSTHKINGSTSTFENGVVTETYIIEAIPTTIDPQTLKSLDLKKAENNYCIYMNTMAQTYGLTLTPDMTRQQLLSAASTAGLSGMPLIEARQTIMELLNDVNVNGGRYGDIAFHPEILGQ